MQRHYLFTLVDLSGRELLRRGPMGVIPLVPLMRHEEPPKEILEKCIDRLKIN